MASINEIVRSYGAEYLKRYGSSMLPSHSRAMEAIALCRTEGMGFHTEECERCGYHHRVFHACKNRSCPLCFFKQTQNWLDKQEQRVLPIHYFHVIFTLPAQFRAIIRRHQKALYPVLFHAAVDSLQALAADKRYLGGKLGIMAVLHTWSGAMIYHPHLHCLIPGAVLTKDGQVVLSHKTYLLPVKALSAKFRGRFLELARNAVPEEDFSQGGDVKKWVVFSKPVESKNAPKVLRYLSRYLHRIALSNASILKVENHQVLFRYKKSTDKQGQSTWAIIRLEVMEFLRRFLQHVLPKGMAKVRYYGFLAPSAQEQWLHLRSHLQLRILLKGLDVQEIRQKEPSIAIRPCPQCGGTDWNQPGDKEKRRLREQAMPP